ncbi:hypothetical protein OAL38_01175, partial [bacterium]|nr:hypothetical protein [bacterium]
MMLPRRCHTRSVIGQALLLVLVVGLTQSTLAERVAYQSSAYPAFADWKSACAELPANRVLLGQAATAKLETALPDFEEVAKALLAAFELFKT